MRLSDEEVFNKLKAVWTKIDDQAALKMLPHVSPETRRNILDKLEEKARLLGAKLI